MTWKRGTVFAWRGKTGREFSAVQPGDEDFPERNDDARHGQSQAMIGLAQQNLIRIQPDSMITRTDRHGPIETRLKHPPLCVNLSRDLLANHGICIVPNETPGI